MDCKDDEICKMTSMGWNLVRRFKGKFQYAGCFSSLILHIFMLIFERVTTSYHMTLCGNSSVLYLRQDVCGTLLVRGSPSSCHFSDGSRKNLEEAEQNITSLNLL